MANESIRLEATKQLVGTSSSRPPLYNPHNPLPQGGGTCIQFSSLLKESSYIDAVLWRQFSVSPVEMDFNSKAWRSRPWTYSASHLVKPLIQRAFMAEDMQVFILS